MVAKITLLGMALAFVPAAAVIAVLFHWRIGGWTAIYATLRMLVQLLLVGYVLIYVFEAESPCLVVAVLALMLGAASWIAMRPVQPHQPSLYLNALVAISVGGALTLALVSQLVIDIQPWFDPRYMVPLAGMIFANAMNTVSLAAERLQSEMGNGTAYQQARTVALHASLIPVINSLLAVGLVALPGMMTGQILSGVSPLVAVKYQIVVMAMTFGASGLSATVYLLLAGRSRAL